MINSNVNIVTGYLGRDVDSHMLESGSVMYSFSVAVTPIKKTPEGEYGTVWFKFTTFSEYFTKFLKKGAYVQVTGNLYDLQAYIDRNGEPQAKPVYSVNNVKVLQFAKDNGSNTSAPAKKKAPPRKEIPF